MEKRTKVKDVVLKMKRNKWAQTDHFMFRMTVYGQKGMTMMVGMMNDDLTKSLTKKECEPPIRKPHPT